MHPWIFDYRTHPWLTEQVTMSNRQAMETCRRGTIADLERYEWQWHGNRNRGPPPRALPVWSRSRTTTLRWTGKGVAAQSTKLFIFFACFFGDYVCRALSHINPTVVLFSPLSPYLHIIIHFTCNCAATSKDQSDEQGDLRNSECNPLIDCKTSEGLPVVDRIAQAL